jgi:hypothetical protein
VWQWSIKRIVLGRLVGTAISTAQIKGTFSRPMALAEAAGKSLTRSGVQVKSREFNDSLLHQDRIITVYLNSSSYCSHEHFQILPVLPSLSWEAVIVFYRLIAISVSALLLEIIDNLPKAESSGQITIYRF